jgi:hypothetical protein
MGAMTRRPRLSRDTIRKTESLNSSAESLRPTRKD